MPNLLAKNFPKIYGFAFFSNLHFISATLIPFFIGWGHLDYQGILFLQAWFMICVFLLEVPTGTVADFFGRKYSLILAGFVNALAVIIYVSYPSIFVFMIGEFLWAVAVSLVSGADESLLYDSLKELGREKEAKKIIARHESFILAGIMFGGPIGSIIFYFFGVRAPIFFMVVPLTIAIIIAFTFKEPKIKRVSEAKRYLDILRQGVSFFFKHRVLKILALDMVVIGSIAYYIIWVYQTLLLRLNVDKFYLGLGHALLTAAEIAVMVSYPWLEKILGGKKRTIFASALITGLGLILAAVTNFLPLLIFAILLTAGFGLSRRPLFASYINQYIDSEQRATVLSTISMFRRFFLIFTNLIVGYFIDFSLNYTLFVLGLIAIAFAFFSKVKEEMLPD